MTLILPQESVATGAPIALNKTATIAYVLLHLGCLGALYTGVDARALVILVGAFVIRAIGVSLVYHRYFAHRTFRTSRTMQFILGVYGTSTVLGGPLWWAQTHREHHRRADTPQDIHSPHYQGFLYSHCGWFLDERHRAVDFSKIRDLARFPELVWLERWSGAFKLLYIGLCYIAFGVAGLVWGFFLPTVIVIQMVHWIQSVSHSVGGYRRYPTADDSRNHWLFGILSLGEGFHHNHHSFPHSARLGLCWWEFDAGYWLLVALARLGLIWNLRVPSREAIEGRASAIERHAFQVRAEFVRAAKRIDSTLAAHEAETGQSCAALKCRISSRLDSFAVEIRNLLVKGPFVLRIAEAELRRMVCAEVCADVPVLTDRMLEIESAIFAADSCIGREAAATETH